MAAEVERNLLNHYRLTNLYPSEWPSRDEDSDDLSDDDVLARAPSKASRISAARLKASNRSTSPASSRRSAGRTASSVVQKDEPDPLGIAPSVVQELRRKGLSVEDDLKLRNRFMLSSTTFSSTLFLSQLHQDASTDTLLQGLDNLSRSIEKKSASLKVLVESNFERFVRAKATIDNVYTEMRAQGAESTNQPVATSLRKPHSRHASRGTITHSRAPSGAFTPNAVKPATDDKRKNALTRESEYGVLGIKTPLIELAVKAEEVWGPALGGRDREDHLKSVLAYVEQHRDTMRLPATVQDCIRKRDYDTLIREYQRAKRSAEQAKSTADRAVQDGAALTDAQIHQIIVSAKVWSDVDTQIDAFRRESMRALMSAPSHQTLPSDHDNRETHMELISVLLRLGVDENPIWLWLSSWYDRLRDKMTRTFDRTRIEIEVLRRKMASVERPSLQNVKVHLQSLATGSATDRISSIDRPNVIEFWETVQTAINSFLALRGGLLGEVTDFWETTESFITGKAQKSFATNAAHGPEAQLSRDHVNQLQHGAADLVLLIREHVFALFTDPPVEDISTLFSPIPATPLSPNPASHSLDGQNPRAFRFDAADMPPPSPRTGDPWEKYAFWPPHANSLSGAQYLARILVAIGTGAGDAAALSIAQHDARLPEQLKSMVNGVRERCVQAVCAAWNSDAEKIKVLEDWTRSGERRDLTNMPARFKSFEETVLAHVQKILYLSEAMTTRPSGGAGGAADGVVAPPSAKLLQMVRSQFVTSLYKALSGTVENAERKKNVTPDDEMEALALPVQSTYGVDGGGSAGDATSRNVRMLLTLSNLHHLRRDIIPHLISTFESAFSVQLTEETSTIRDVLSQIDARLFQSYVKPTIDRLSQLITTGITSRTWAPTPSEKPTNARPYIYDVLLVLVLTHTEVSTSAAGLAAQILSYQLEQISAALLAAFQLRPTYSLASLMQATLDVELVAQTLSNYTTEKASETQSRIYLVLDERTDNEARMRLQAELPEMRAVLKRLREGTKGQFGCFKRERRGRSERPGSSRAVA